MERAREGNGYKSPQRKLVQFFEKSRDQWKAKAGEAKKTVKSLKNRMGFLARSKEHWKKKAKELEDELARMKAKEQAREKEWAELKKRGLRRAGVWEALKLLGVCRTRTRTLWGI